MYIPDLTCLPATHPPSPYDFPLPYKREEKWGVGRLPAGLSLLAVGWIGTPAFSTGLVPESCIDALFAAYVRADIFSDSSQGWHDCVLCTTQAEWYPESQVGPIIHWRGQTLRLYGHGHYLIRYRESVYMAPALILHYILDHSYQPPARFIEAVTQGSFLTFDDLIWEENDHEILNAA